MSLNYVGVAKDTSIQSWAVTEMLATEVLRNETW